MSIINFELANLDAIYFILILSLILPIILQRKRYRKLYHHHKTLVQEKEAALGFVQNVGSIFEDAESVEMNQLLERVLHYAVRTCKAGSGAIYLLDKDESMLSARALSGVIPPLFELSSNSLKVGPDTTHQLHKILSEKKISLGETLIGEVALKGNSEYIYDAEMDVRVPQTNIDF